MKVKTLLSLTVTWYFNGRRVDFREIRKVDFTSDRSGTARKSLKKPSDPWFQIFIHSGFVTRYGGICMKFWVIHGFNYRFNRRFGGRGGWVGRRGGGGGWPVHDPPLAKAREMLLMWNLVSKWQHFSGFRPTTSVVCRAGRPARSARSPQPEIDQN